MAGYGYMNRGYTNDWNRSSYGGNGYPDGEGMRRPTTSYSPNHSSEGYITSAERIVENVRAPVVVTEYGYGSPTKVEPVKDYGVYNDKWRMPSGPIYDRPQRVEEFITDANRSARPGLPQSPTNWRNPPNSGTTGYGEYTNFDNSDSNKPNGYINKDGWDRPGRKGLTVPPSYDTPLSAPTHDIGKAVEVLKDAAKSSLVSAVTSATPQPWFAAPGSTVPNRDAYTETVGSMEAARRYGNLNLSSRRFRAGDSYTGTIDDREPARRY